MSTLHERRCAKGEPIPVLKLQELSLIDSPPPVPATADGPIGADGRREESPILFGHPREEDPNTPYDNHGIAQLCNAEVILSEGRKLVRYSLSIERNHEDVEQSCQFLRYARAVSQRLTALTEDTWWIQEEPSIVSQHHYEDELYWRRSWRAPDGLNLDLDTICAFASNVFYLYSVSEDRQ